MTKKCKKCPHILSKDEKEHGEYCNHCLHELNDKKQLAMIKAKRGDYEKEIKDTN